MKRTRTRWWAIFAACCFLTLGGVGWATAAMVELDHSQSQARLETRHQERLRLALWRMDSWLGAFLGREAARTVPGFLEDFASPVDTPFVRFHFELDADGEWYSTPTEPEDLADLMQRITKQALEERLQRLEVELPAFLEEVIEEPVQVAVQQRQSEMDWNGFLNRQELAQRKGSNVAAQTLMNDLNWDPLLGSPGPLLPLWIEEAGKEDTPILLFARSAQSKVAGRIQGFVVDWDRMRTELTSLVEADVPGANLVPLAGDPLLPDGAHPCLAAIPARLDAMPPDAGPLPISAATRITLGFIWGATLLVLVAIGLTLRASVDYGTKRSRFASAVTHELRTPLTTFRMYSEMLAKDMVPDERRVEYLETLQGEADRLSGLVENVLAYARLEEGTTPRRRERIAVTDLVERILPDLHRRAEGAGMNLAVDLDEATDLSIETDPEAVRQVLFNLMDNACKYGRSEDASHIDLTVEAIGSDVTLVVRDHGPGVPSSVAKSVFHPFDRGAVDPADTNPGIGLGLALARGLARDLGGDLVLETPKDGGARFRLYLPS